MEARKIICETHDKIGVVRLNNPPLNLQTNETSNQLLSVLALMRDDAEIKVIVLTGSGGKVFCAGSDIKEFPKLKGDFIEGKIRLENEVFTQLEAMPVPVIAAIDGAAMGGGAELALACDLRVMDETASIRFPEITLGNFPGSGAIFRLSRIAGEAKAIELMSLACPLSAEQALSIGLISRAAPAGLAFQTAMELAELICETPSEMLRLIKKWMRACRGKTSAEAAAAVSALYLHSRIQ